MVGWREKLHLSSAREARDDALRALPDVIGDLTPVAVVRNSISDTSGRTWAAVRSELVFRDEFVPALDGLGGFSHAFVVTWLNHVTDDGRALLRIRPTGDERSPEVGVFATRTAHRPNPIAVSIVPLEGVSKNVVKVVGLDVVDGTPVLDIKPYVSFYDSFDAEVPTWAE
jgi:tRNA-Thr(GGU) m(6)t(6)A37 methyltransferase TsaA